MSEPGFIGLDDFLDFRIQLINNLINLKSCESFNPGQIPVQTIGSCLGEKTEELIEEINKELAA